MCGIFGVMGPGIIQADLEAVKQLGIVSQFRGLDGAGIYQIKSEQYNYRSNFDNNEDWWKQEGTFSNLIRDIDKDSKSRILKTCLVDIIMGHVRWATKGVISSDNAHPFDFDNIAGAHNGTLKDDKYTKHSTKTDSELMFEDINERGIETVLESLDRDSAYAISMYDKKTKDMVFVTNELRPLAIAFCTTRSVMYWASEIGMLRYVLERANISNKRFNLLPNHLIRLRVRDMFLSDIKEDPLKCLRVTKLNRPYPTSVQKYMDEQEKKRQFEEKFKASQVQVQTPSTPSTPGTNVLNFPASSTMKSGNIAQQYNKCKCGKFNLNIVQSSKARRGTHQFIKYSTTEDAYYCSDCTTKEIEHGTVQ